MPAAVRMRSDFSAGELRRLAATTQNANQSRRLLSLAAVLDGMSRAQAARIGGMDRQTLRDWIHRFNQRGPDGLTDTWSKGNRPRLSPDQQTELAQIVETGPDRVVHGVVRWRRVDLQRLIAERFGVIYHERTVGKILRQIGFSHISARPRHPAQDERIMAEFKKLCGHAEGPPRRPPQGQAGRDLVPGRDAPWTEERNGSPVGAARITPAPTADQRYESAYLFGAICPARGTGAALALPYADTEAMQLHLDEIARTVARGAHAVLLLDRAGWHTTRHLVVPKNLTLVFLPSRSPELNPVENVWQYLRQTWLSNRVFDTYEAIIEAACEAWRKLVAQPETITSIGLRNWAHIVQS